MKTRARLNNDGECERIGKNKSPFYKSVFPVDFILNFLSYLNILSCLCYNLCA